MSLIKIAAEELNKILDEHELYVDEGGSQGERADFSGADLSGANLSGANLGGANLSDANLMVANLRRVDLIGANLRGVNLQLADTFQTVFDSKE